ncbi:MAG: hypothetical protein ABEJ68_03515 [Halobacteriaceae archaeon]
MLRVSTVDARAVTRPLQALVVVVGAVGLASGRVDVVVNAGLGFAVTMVPAALRRDFGVPVHPLHALWIAGAVALHAVGVLGPYRSLWWHALTHAVSASLVAGAAYVSVSAVDRHVPNVSFPPAFLVAVTLLATMAAGVLWEVLEFLAAFLGEAVTGRALLTRYGLEDTMVDLLFDAAGGVVVAAARTPRLRLLAATVAARIQRMRES